MTSATVERPSARLFQAEIAVLAKPKKSPKVVIGMIAAYVGMALIVIYCIIPF